MPRPQVPAVSRDDLAEIIFTSGATSDPKGVLISHRNILANIVPVETEVRKYRQYGRPFFPIRFLNLLPLSHMFGQAMATFIPPMLAGHRRVHARIQSGGDHAADPHAAHLRAGLRAEDSGNPARPRRPDLSRNSAAIPATRSTGCGAGGDTGGCTACSAGSSGRSSWARRRSPPELEEFWSRLGYIVIQGYGLTETAPIVTLNHPFHARKGTVGSPIGGVEVKIAADGEILVRGENVTKGYYDTSTEGAALDSEGWLHTGDIGEIDAENRLSIRGRKKEMIVTPGRAERLSGGCGARAEPGARRARFGGGRHRPRTGRAGTGSRRRHGRGGAAANAQLQDHQRIRSAVAYGRAPNCRVRRVRAS